MHISVHNAKHARDARPTKVNIQDANLKDTMASSGVITRLYLEIPQCTQIKNKMVLL